ncbi:hypothetical protein [Microbacterium saccharophilum]|uniref:hypothetical protein n=1 Tax=Microbacterium saccharophilum TaxID=1213358 RepID=UPI001C3F6D62|nr:hypothetical protein [Microbacterium saccharophilum]
MASARRSGAVITLGDGLHGNAADVCASVGIRNPAGVAEPHEAVGRRQVRSACGPGGRAGHVFPPAIRQEAVIAGSDKLGPVGQRDAECLLP